MAIIVIAQPDAKPTLGASVRRNSRRHDVGDGIDVEQQLPALSTYLGHTCVRDTYWYLSACPELMAEAARRLDRRWEAKP